jgi:CubicO group peptidase (beta-lactamase class C family)
VLDGTPVVDLWCGFADAARTRAWQQHTLVNTFSVGKALASLCVLMLAARGDLDLDQRIAEHWPEFASEGKEQITVRELLSHRAGLAAIAQQLPEGALYDWDQVTKALAKQAPWWVPGSGHGYHVHTFGFLLGELVARVSGRRIGAFLREEIAEPCNARVSFGLAAKHRADCAEYVFDADLAARRQANDRARRQATRSQAGDGAPMQPSDRSPVDPRLRERAYLNPPGATGIGTVNTAAWRGAELPSANLHADARGIARVYQAIISAAQPLLDRDLLREATAEAAAGDDLVLGRPSRFGLGFQLSQPERPLGPNLGSFGHFGAGGSVGFADPEAQLAFAYVTNRGGPQWQDPRNRALIDAVYEALGR